MKQFLLLISYFGARALHPRMCTGSFCQAVNGTLRGGSAGDAQSLDAAFHQYSNPTGIESLCKPVDRLFSAEFFKIPGGFDAPTRKKRTCGDGQGVKCLLPISPQVRVLPLDVRCLRASETLKKYRFATWRRFEMPPR